MKFTKWPEGSTGSEFYQPIATNITKRVVITPANWPENPAAPPPPSEYLHIPNVNLWQLFSTLARIRRDCAGEKWSTVQATSCGLSETFDPTRPQWTLIPLENSILLKLDPETYQQFGLGQHRLVEVDKKDKALCVMRYVKVSLHEFDELENPLTQKIIRDDRIASILSRQSMVGYISADADVLDQVVRLFNDPSILIERKFSSANVFTVEDCGAGEEAPFDLADLSIESLDRYLGSLVQNCSGEWRRSNDVPGGGGGSFKVKVESGVCLPPFNFVFGKEEGWAAVMEYCAVNAPCWQRSGEITSQKGGVSIVQILTRRLKEFVRMSYVIENYLGC